MLLPSPTMLACWAVLLACNVRERRVGTVPHGPMGTLSENLTECQVLAVGRAGVQRDAAEINAREQSKQQRHQPAQRDGS